MLTWKLCPRGGDEQVRSPLAEAGVGQSPIIMRRRSDLDHLSRGASQNLFDAWTVAINKKRSGGRQQFSQTTFFLRNAFEIPKKFKVFASDARNDAETWLNQPHQRRQFAWMVGPQFEHSRLMAAVEPEESQRNANVVIEAGLTR